MGRDLKERIKKLLLTAIQVRALCYVAIRYEDDFHVLDDTLGKRREIR